LTTLARSLPLEVRPFREEDEPRVLELLEASLGPRPGGKRSRELFRWKHLEGPFGRSLLLVAEADGKVVGLRALLRWRFRAGDRIVHAVRAVDTATHPDYRRRGIFSELTRDGLERLQGTCELVFNTPNPRSLMGYTKLGWRSAGRLPVHVRVRRPLAVLAGLPSLRRATLPSAAGPPIAAEPVAMALQDSEGVSALLAEGASSGDRRLRTARDVAYLRWRYGAAPELDYRAVRDEAGGRLRGLAILRVRRRGTLRETMVSELLTAAADHNTARRLLDAAALAAPVDHVVCALQPETGLAGGALRAGFLRAPRGILLAVRPLAPVEPDPTELRSWALSLGDVELL
jgi:GNAT superfamily N-acetyltransferase